MRAGPRAGVLVVFLALAGLCVAPAITSADDASPACSSQGVLTQAMNGAISGCLEVGVLPAGAHTVTLDQVPQFGGDAGPGARGPAVALSIAPASGAPGTKVTITGTVSRAVNHESADPDLCWDGCGEGLQYNGITVDWTSSRRFTMRLVVPAAPWVQGDPVRVHPLASGPYPITIDCVVSGRGCDGSGPEGSVTFDLRVARQPAWCRTAASCAQLRLSPASGPPGRQLRVHGYAPLLSVDGSDQPFVFELGVRRGRPHGAAVSFAGRDSASFGQAPLTVTAPPSFASLGASAPQTEVTDGLSPIAAAPGNPEDVAWCDGSAIQTAQDGAVSTAAVSAAVTAMGFGTIGDEQPQCVAVAPLGGDAFAAAFSVDLPKYGAPPVYDVALETSDGGAVWSSLPVPPGASADAFGGFRAGPTAVTAVYAATTPNRRDPAFPNMNATAPLTETSIAATGVARGWRAGGLGCPATGPCVTLGPFLTANCAMGLSTQYVLRSTDGGARWSQPAMPDQLEPCGDAQLAATGSHTVLLVNSLSPYSVERSTDSGHSWTDVGLPAVPGAGEQAFGLGAGPGGLTLLPDGALLLSGVTKHWELLRPGTRAWCIPTAPDAAVQRDDQAASLTVIGENLWWQTTTATGSGTTPPAIHQLPLASLSCG